MTRRILLTLAILWCSAWPAVAQEGSSATDSGGVRRAGSEMAASNVAESRPISLSRFDAGHMVWSLLGAFTALLLVTPGLALFYFGMSGQGRLPQVLVEYLFVAAILSLAWVLWIYSLAFSPNDISGAFSKNQAQSTGEQAESGSRFLGGTEHVALRRLDSRLEHTAIEYPVRRADDVIPHLLFLALQLGVFLAASAPLSILLSPSLRLPARTLFLVLWGTFVYAPVACWIWGGGWQAAALDRAGGLVVHVSAGFSALALAFGRRPADGVIHSETEPGLAATGLGTLLFWGGSLLLNAGLALAANGSGVNALVVTHLAGCAGVISWTGCDWLVNGKLRLVGICQGAMSGLFAIAAGCGSVTPQSSILIGLAAGIACQTTFRLVSARPSASPLVLLFALQGVAGGLGVIFTGVFATASVAGLDRRGNEIHGLLSGGWEQLIFQGTALGSVAAVAIIGTLLAAGIVRGLFRQHGAPEN